MFPILFHVGPLTVRTYGAMVALAFLVSLEAAKGAAKARRISESFLLDLVALLILSGLLGARLFYVLLNWSYFLQHPLEVIKVWEGGLVFYGGFILATLVGIAFCRTHRVPVGPVADCLSPALAIGQGIGRWGCFFAGCCYGKPTALPWGLKYSDPTSLAPLGIRLHPTQLYESAGDFLLAGVLGLMLKRNRGSSGDIFWFYILFYGLLRFVVEVFRGDDRGAIVGGLAPSQMISLVAILIAGSILLVKKTSHHDAHT
jgi:phosphatidylglycerol---prolipoprotein diacylglyceryl transferase